MGCNGKSSTNSKGCIRPALKSLKGPHVEYCIGDALREPSEGANETEAKNKGQLNKLKEGSNRESDDRSSHGSHMEQCIGMHSKVKTKKIPKEMPKTKARINKYEGTYWTNAYAHQTQRRIDPCNSWMPRPPLSRHKSREATWIGLSKEPEPHGVDLNRNLAQEHQLHGAFLGWRSREH